jgi:outer membrane lipoprotein-sorting protein
MTITLEMAAMPPGVSAEGVQMIVAPDRVRFEMSAMGMAILQIVNGDEGWIKQGPMPTGALNAEQVKTLRNDAERLENNPWIGILDGKIEATAGGTVDEDGRQAAVIGVKEKDEPTVYYVDVETGDVLRTVNILDGARSESVLREFKEFDGRRIATHRTQLINGVEQATITVKNMEFNIELDEALFTAPE